MTENKHFTIEKSFIAEDTFCIRDNSGKFSFPITPDKSELIMYQKALNELKEENEQLKKDVRYWKQVASLCNNELNAFEHCKKYKPKCKDIHWSSD